VAQTDQPPRCGCRCIVHDTQPTRQDASSASVEIPNDANGRAAAPAGTPGRSALVFRNGHRRGKWDKRPVRSSVRRADEASTDSDRAGGLVAAIPELRTAIFPAPADPDGSFPAAYAAGPHDSAFGPMSPVQERPAACGLSHSATICNVRRADPTRPLRCCVIPPSWECQYVIVLFPAAPNPSAHIAPLSYSFRNTLTP
jgi:hypothetical protein